MGGSLISITDSNIKTGQLPANGSIQIGFDRLLNPATVLRQTVPLRDLSGQPLTPTVQYDPVARTVTLSSPAGGPWLVAGTVYRVDVGAIRAIDGALVDPAIHNPMEFTASASTAAPAQTDAGPDAAAATPATADPTVDFCHDVLPIFQRSCVASICHGVPRPTMDTAHFGSGAMSRPAAGLILEYSEDFRQTAVTRVANGSNTGPIAGAGASPQRLFGVDMPLIDPGVNGSGDPGNSWLMYKILLAQPADESSKNFIPELGSCT